MGMLEALTFDILARPRTDAGFKRVKDDLRGIKGALAGVNDQAKRVGRSMRNIGAGFSLAVTAPLTLGLRSVVEDAGNFEQSMNRVSALSGATGESFKALDQQARDLGSTTKFSASQAADAMGFLAMAGFEAEQIMGAMPSTLQLAAAASTDLATSADIVSNILTGFGKNVGDLAEVNDVLVKTMTSANTDLRMLGDAMKYVGPVAASAKIRFNETAAAIGMLGNAGIQGEMGGTALRGMITRLLSPSKQAAGVMREFGINVLKADGSLMDLAGIMDAFGPHAENTGLLMQVFGQRAGPAMAALLSQGSDKLREFEGVLDSAGGTAERIADVQMQGINGAITELKSAVEGLKVAIGKSGFIEWLTDITKSATGFVRSMAEADPALVRIGLTAAGVAAAAGPLLVFLGTATLGFTGLTTAVGAFTAVLVANPIGVAVVALGALAGALHLSGKRAREAAAAGYVNMQSTDNLTRAIGDEITQSNLLGAALQAGTTMSVDAAEKKLAEAKARLENVQAIYEEKRALGLAAAGRQGVGAASVYDEQAEMMDARLRNGEVVDPYGNRTPDGSDFFDPRSQAQFEGRVTPQGVSGPIFNEEHRQQVDQLQDDIDRLRKGIADSKDGVVTFGDAITAIVPGDRSPFEELTGDVDAFGGAAKNVADEVDEVAERIKAATKEMAGMFAKGTSDMLFGVKSVEQGLGDLARRMLSMATDKALMNLFTMVLDSTGLGASWAGILANANGNAFSGGQVTAFANGGVVNSPTFFGMKNGTGLMGEAGPEAIMPLARGTGGKLGVRAQVSAAGGGDQVINLELNVHSSGGEQQVRAEQTGPGKVDLYLENAVKGGIARGKFDSVFSQRFGLKTRAQGA